MVSKQELMLAEMLKYEGWVEGKNNDNPFGKYFGLNNNPYCSLAISYFAESVGITFFKNIKDKTGKYYLTGCTNRYCAYVPSLYNYAKRLGILKTDPNTFKKGDVLLFNMNGVYPDGIKWSDHTGLFISYNTKTKKVETIEANTSSTNKLTNDGGGIFRKYRSMNCINGAFSVG